MISAIVFVPDTKRRGPARDQDRDRELLVRSLVWLVSAVVSGIVNDVTLAGPASLDLADIADQAGCAIAVGEHESDRLSAAIAFCKYPRVLIITSGFQPLDSIIGELESSARTLRPDTSARILAAPATLWERMFPDRAATIGLLAPTARCRALRSRTFASLETGLEARSVLATRAYPIV